MLIQLLTVRFPNGPAGLPISYHLPWWVPCCPATTGEIDNISPWNGWFLMTLPFFPQFPSFLSFPYFSFLLFSFLWYVTVNCLLLPLWHSIFPWFSLLTWYLAISTRTWSIEYVIWEECRAEREKIDFFEWLMNISSIAGTLGPIQVNATWPNDIWGLVLD